ncbi:MFS transporter [Phaeacidiphilus oryzae]|uniref:MFS transporter n=1 Tax=Phaeacidiphilus oryzae TaxID=348818 RepID=UPI00055AADBE|nr:MFS transporter [Phaeacidiphilus oryzae]
MREPAAVDARTQRPTARQLTVIGAVLLLSLIIPLELTLVYPAVRFMAPVFHTPSISWVLTIVSLTGVVLESPVGKLADLHGKKRVALVISALFAIGSLLCALAPNFPLLLMGRVLQGVALGMIAVLYGLLRDILPAPLVPFGFGVISVGLGVSAILGPFVGGALIDHYGFRAVFWFSVIAVTVLGVLFAAVVPESPVRLPQRLDLLGSALLGGGVGLLLLATTEGAVWGWTSAGTLGCYLGGAAAVALFVPHTLRNDHPLVDVRTVAGPQMRLPVLATLLCAFAVSGFAFLTPELLEMRHHMDAMGAARYQLPYGITAIVAGLLGGALTRRRGSRITLLAATVPLCVSLLLLALAHGSTWMILIWCGLYGIAFALYPLATMVQVAEAVPADRTAVSEGVNGIARDLGSAVAIAVLTAVLNRHIEAAPGGGGAAALTYTDGGFTIAFLVAAGSGLLAAVAAAVMRHRRLDGADATGGASASAPDGAVSAA